MIYPDPFDDVTERTRGWKLIAAWLLLLLLSFCLVLGAFVAGRMVMTAAGLWVDPATVSAAVEPNPCATF